MPTSSLVRDALFETGRIWPVRPGPVTRDQRLGHDPLRRIPGTGASRHYRLAATRRPRPRESARVPVWVVVS